MLIGNIEVNHGILINGWNRRQALQNIIVKTEANKEQEFALYIDTLDRKIVDMAGDEDQKGEWQPVNNPAAKLCKCIEGLRDIQETIEQVNSVQAPKKRRRRLRGISVPLHALCIATRQLIESIKAETSIHALLPEDCTLQLTRLQERFGTLVPFGSKEKLGLLRNKVGAHYDKDMSPAEMRDLVKSLTSSEIGGWINNCLATLCDLLKLNAYKWSTEAPDAYSAVILCEQPTPVMSIVEVDLQQGRITGFRGSFLTKSPRTVIFETIIKEVAKSADTLFVDGSNRGSRISGFHEDLPGVGWSAVLNSRFPTPQPPTKEVKL